ncbi:MAG TPA: endonuclease domain-containing protein [Dongiaceae bacterium]|nr:endonuclease domain-containing protein [Dongiaceae bacterium]
MVRKKSSSETRLPPPQPSPNLGEGVDANANPLPQHGGGLGWGKRLPGLSANDEKPTYKIRTRTKTLKRARQLREQPTDAEMRLWKHLRQQQINGAHFRKQCPVGPYIADFACLRAKLIIELDGGQHADSATDAVRDAWFIAHGYRTLRFWNTDVLANTEGVITMIIEALGHLESTPNAQAH